MLWNSQTLWDWKHLENNSQIVWQRIPVISQYGLWIFSSVTLTIDGDMVTLFLSCIIHARCFCAVNYIYVVFPNLINCMVFKNSALAI